MVKLKSRNAPPKASAMVEALRGLGYNTQTAIADIIDNSIAAKAKRVDIRFTWSEKSSRIEIQDDGNGMSAKQIDLAMRLGESNPLDNRSADDLGRFGMGLKTASFSQCRRLTVATIGSDGFQCLRWDLDVLANCADGGWHLLEDPSEGSEHYLYPLEVTRQGTLVLWELLDRILSKGFTDTDFLNLIDKVEQHLAMTFHRYIEGITPPLEIRINDKKLTPWDPFLAGHPAKPWHSPTAMAPGFKGVEVECHVLPHKDKLSQTEFESAQGSDGWTAQQGFYVYRNKRLLLAGSWLGLGHGRSWTKDEAHKLARIRLDIPNNADVEWKIDIRKSTARPPVALRPWLVRYAEETRNRARRAFAHRGAAPRTNNGKKVTQAWAVKHLSDGIKYRIDRDHPSVRDVLDSAGNLLPQLQAMLRVIEETVPVQRIWLDTAEQKETPRNGFAAEPTSEIINVLEVMYKSMVSQKGMSPEYAKERLMQTEPFNNYPDLIKSLSKIWPRNNT